MLAVSDLVVSKKATIDRLQAAMASMPQLEMHTNHYFADGMYVRELFIPKGATIVGKQHKTEHFFILSKGALRVTTDEGVKDVYAPAVLVSAPGAKRAGHALEDTVCLNVHKVSSTDLDEVEKELIEDDGLSLFDARNKLKALSAPESKEITECHS